MPPGTCLVPLWDERCNFNLVRTASDGLQGDLAPAEAAPYIIPPEFDHVAFDRIEFRGHYSGQAHELCIGQLRDGHPEKLRPRRQER